MPGTQPAGGFQLELLFVKPDTTSSSDISGVITGGFQSEGCA
jgi:hypothetical protein